MEGYFFRQDPKRAPGDFGGHGFLGVGRNFIFDFDPIEFKDPAVRKTKEASFMKSLLRPRGPPRMRAQLVFKMVIFKSLLCAR